MIIVIVGPTSVGKTKLSIELAKRMNAEIINADSLQVYRGLDIGTAKITKEEQENIPHHLLDICDVTTNYTVFDYQRDGRKAIEEIQNRQKNVIIVGGTGLYIRALLYDYEFPKEEKTYDFSQYSNEELYAEIKKQDPTTSVDSHNRRRLERALIHLKEGYTPRKSKPLYAFTMIGLTLDRNTLYQKIDTRVDKMMSAGLLREVQSFYQKNIRSKALLTGIGYKELYAYLDNKISLRDAIQQIKKNSRHYAKRQYTFFNNQFENIPWFSVNEQDFSQTIEEVFQYLSS